MEKMVLCVCLDQGISTSRSIADNVRQGMKPLSLLQAYICTIDRSIMHEGSYFRKHHLSTWAVQRNRSLEDCTTAKTRFYIVEHLRIKDFSRLIHSSHISGVLLADRSTGPGKGGKKTVVATVRLWSHLSFSPIPTSRRISPSSCCHICIPIVIFFLYPGFSKPLPTLIETRTLPPVKESRGKQKNNI